MNSVSSPLAYPLASSPHDPSPRKKRKLKTERTPLQTIPTNCPQTFKAGFLLDDSDSDDEHNELLKNKHSNKEQWPQLEVDCVEHVAERSFPSDTHHHVQPYRAETLRLTKLVESHNSITFQDTTLPSQRRVPVNTCSGKVLSVAEKRESSNLSYEKLIAARSTVVPGRARKSYYGINIHEILEECSKDKLARSQLSKNMSTSPESPEDSSSSSMPVTAYPSKIMWTEKYRARKFTDLVGDERTHRSVLQWIKAWDPVVFPSSGKPKLAKVKRQEGDDSGYKHRKILLIAGPPGLGKTTLAHVCAKQAGYEVQEINASDERSRDVVKGRISDMLCTENIRPAEMTSAGKLKRVARPVCVVVDEVDGVVGGSGTAGDGGFIKALMDLLILDQKNSPVGAMRNTASVETRKKRKGGVFRLQRPLILICNDLYHPSLRLLRQSNMAEIIHIRKPPLSMIIPRLHMIFEKEGILSDTDGIRHLCEATWGSSTKKDQSTGSTGEGDMRGILVVGEWVASKFRADVERNAQRPRLTRKWLEENILCDLTHGGGAARGLGRGSTKEIVEKIFTYNGGFSASAQSSSSSTSSSTTRGHAESARHHATARLKDMIDCSGEEERLMTDCFSEYPARPFQDDNFLSKPCLAYDWLHFYDTLSTLVHTSQEWELAPYLSTSLLAFHHLFASTSAHPQQNFASSSVAKTIGDANDAIAVVDPTPFSGSRASYDAHEVHKAASAALIQLQSQLCLSLQRSFRSIGHLSTDLLPYVLRILNPDIKPVIVGGSEKGIASVRRGPERELVQRAVNAMVACNIRFDKAKVEGELPGNGLRKGSAVCGWVYRMEPALEVFGAYDTAAKSDDTNLNANKVRYAVRQILEQEWKREVVKRDQEARVRRVTETVQGGRVDSAASALEIQNVAKAPNESQPPTAVKVKKDFFGRSITVAASAPTDAGMIQFNEDHAQQGTGGEMEGHGRIWVTFREGYSNAVRRRITLKELLEDL